MGAHAFMMPRARASGPRPRRAFGEALGERQPRHRLAQGPRDGAENTARAGLREVARGRAAIFLQTLDRIRLWPLAITGRTSFEENPAF